jgi:hypothetical protein
MVALGAYAFGSTAIIAAEIRKDAFSGSMGAVLEGKIEPGDLEKLRSFIHDEPALEIYLASPGGDLAEAMKIGRLLRALKVTTIVPDAGVPTDLQEKTALIPSLDDHDR